MNKALIGTLAALAVVPASVALACTSNGKEGIFPENNLYIPASRFAGFSTSEQEFRAAVAKAQRVYEGTFANKNLTLKIIADWEDGTVNAYAKQNGNVAEVHMFGGLARHDRITADGFMMVVCHEMGHHIGGAPQVGQLPWASNEGQSDYFATLKCARELWKDEDNAAVVAAMTIPPIVTERCQKGFDKTEEINICVRGAMAGKSLADTLASLKKSGGSKWPLLGGGSSGPALPAFETPDANKVETTDDKHPAAQCRLDTYFAGAVCPKSKDVDVSKTDLTAGVCAAENGEVLGVRPACWYAQQARRLN